MDSSLHLIPIGYLLWSVWVRHFLEFVGVADCGCNWQPFCNANKREGEEGSRRKP